MPDNDAERLECVGFRLEHKLAFGIEGVQKEWVLLEGVKCPLLLSVVRDERGAEHAGFGERDAVEHDECPDAEAVAPALRRKIARAEAAAAAGLRVGLGIPVLDKGTASCAVLLLSSERTPLARTFEVWLPDRLGPRLASSRTLTPEAESSRPPCPALAEAVIGSLVPQLEHGGSGPNVGLPIFGGKSVASVVVLRG